MTANYSTARGKLQEITEWLNEEDCDTVELRYIGDALPVDPGPDYTPALGTLTDGELSVLATHSCPGDLSVLRAGVEAMRREAQDGAFFYAEESVYDQILDLIDRRAKLH